MSIDNTEVKKWEEDNGLAKATILNNIQDYLIPLYKAPKGVVELATMLAIELWQPRFDFWGWEGGLKNYIWACLPPFLFNKKNLIPLYKGHDMQKKSWICWRINMGQNLKLMYNFSWYNLMAFICLKMIV